MEFSRSNAFAEFVDYEGSAKVNISKYVRQYDGSTPNSLEHDLLKIVSNDITGKEKVPKIKLTDDTAKWRVVSALQKSIRRGDVTMAVKCAVALDRHDSKYLWRRLAIIGFEDGGIPMLPLTAFICSVAGKDKYREHLGAAWITAYVVEQMALCPKDRSFCETANAAHRGLSKDLEDALFDKDSDLEEVLRMYKVKNPVAVRYICGRALIGGLKRETKKNGNTVTEYAPADRTALMDYIDSTDLPMMVKYVTRRGISLGAEGLPVAVPLVWERFAAPSEKGPIKISERELPECVMIGKLPSVCYDKHTLEGKKAYGYFLKSCVPVKEWLEENYGDFAKDWTRILGSAIFYSESGMVFDIALNHPYWRYIFKEAYEAEASYYSLPLKKLFEFYNLVGVHIPDLNKARRVICGDNSQGG